MWRVVKAPLRGGNFLREGLRIAPVTTIASVMWHRPLHIFHHDLVVERNKIIMDAAGRLGWPLVVPVDVFVVSWSREKGSVGI